MRKNVFIMKSIDLFTIAGNIRGMSTSAVVLCIYGAVISFQFAQAFKLHPSNNTNRTIKAFREKRIGVYSKYTLFDPLIEIPDIQLIDGMEQSDKPYECGTRPIMYEPGRSARVIGGQEVPYGAFPWQVEIQIFNIGKKKFEHQCGGALIGDRIVITAAHCLQVPQLEYLRLVLGQHILHQRDLFEHGYRIDAIVLHPDYRKRGPYSSDIGLLRVRTPHTLGIAFNTHIRTICLPENGFVPPPGTWCTVTGWGAHDSNDINNIDGVLRAASVPVLDLDTCRKDSINGGRTQKVLDTMLCAGFLKGGIDACGGDSGGPLACESEGRFILSGIVSWGDGCAKRNRPGVYTRVDAFSDWIRRSMKELE